jgi:small redox-active disulfide protein 2
MRIEVLGDSCSKCGVLWDHVRQAVAEAGVEVELSRTNDPESLNRFGVRTLPGLVLDGRVVSSGKILSVAELKKLIQP